MRLAIVFICMAASAASCSSINDWLGLEDDHPIEQATEAVIQSQTGLNVDLTP